ncbi:hypothetical protein MRB53_038963 [Persea americana]|nr:hypothetical protein MRB53_038963 [Persea americana]
MAHSGAPPLPQSRDDINGTWTYLQWGVERIMNNLRDGLDLKTYMTLYTSITISAQLKRQQQAHISILVIVELIFLEKTSTSVSMTISKVI